MKQPMTTFNLCTLANDINNGWPTHVKVDLLPAVGRYIDEGKEKTYNFPQGNLCLSYIKNPNERFKRAVVLRDIGVGAHHDKYIVHIHLSDGVYKSNGDDIRAMVEEYITDRMSELKTDAVYLSKTTQEYPIEWSVNTTSNESGSELFVSIRGMVYIPVCDIETGKLELDDVSKLLCGGMSLVEHPNHHDSYLKLNHLGYIDDSWTATV